MFEGEFRLKPSQNLAGTNLVKNKEDLLLRAHKDRADRELKKLKTNNAIKIQSVYRSYMCRAHIKKLFRAEFDEKLNIFLTKQELKANAQAVMLSSLLHRIIFIFDIHIDLHRLNQLCQTVIKIKDNFLCWIFKDNFIPFYKLKQLLLLSLRTLGKLAAVNQSLSMCLRILEIFLDVNSYQACLSSQQIQHVFHILFSYLIENGFYKDMLSVLEHRVAADLEFVGRPTPLSSLISSLINTSFLFIANNHSALELCCTELLANQQTNRMRGFVLPMFGVGVVPMHELLLAVHSSPHIDSIYLAHSILFLSSNYYDTMNEDDLSILLFLIRRWVVFLQPITTRDQLDDDDNDVDDEEHMASQDYSDPNSLKHAVISMVNDIRLTNRIVEISETANADMISSICALVYTLIHHYHAAIHKTELLYMLAYRGKFLFNLWTCCHKTATTTLTGNRMLLVEMLARGVKPSGDDLREVGHLLVTFSSLYLHFLLSLHDAEFTRPDQKLFSLSGVVEIIGTLRDCCLGIIDLTHPDSKHHVTEATIQENQILHSIFKTAVKLVNQLHERDCRLKFCGEGFWLARNVIVRFEKNSLLLNNSSVFDRRAFGSLSILNCDRLDEGLPPLSTIEVRRLVILTELPYVIPFQDRIKIFHDLVHSEKIRNDVGGYIGGELVTIRRNYLYEDAFEKLSPQNQPSLKVRLQIHLVNFVGLDEAGVDGGGLLREFLGELTKTAFDANRGFFQTTSDKLLYPNHQARFLVDDFRAHFFFMGRILGKLLYEKILAELPFALFFLSKLLSRQSGDVDIHHLASLDPEMYRNLLFLKDYEGDAADLGLDFTVANNNMGLLQIDELKAGGKDIAVTNANKIEYIHLMAYYRLNKQIKEHTTAFREGLGEVISMEWLRMFDANELQTLISGALAPIDVQDLRDNTNYSGGYTADHECILWFWEVVHNFTDQQKRQLLKFVTSCSRPPLLGFKELYPVFCIQYAGKDEDRLPTASTCMNFLKLPHFPSLAILRDKLVYAIESGAGFELS